MFMAGKNARSTRGPAVGLFVSPQSVLGTPLTVIAFAILVAAVSWAGFFIVGLGYLIVFKLVWSVKVVETIWIVGSLAQFLMDNLDPECLLTDFFWGGKFPC
jgi:hypothetical protein